jgi:hypothetical protein
MTTAQILASVCMPRDRAHHVKAFTYVKATNCLVAEASDLGIPAGYAPLRLRVFSPKTHRTVEFIPAAVDLCAGDVSGWRMVPSDRTGLGDLTMLVVNV